MPDLGPELVYGRDSLISQSNSKDGKEHYAATTTKRAARTSRALPKGLSRSQLALLIIVISLSAIGLGVGLGIGLRNKRLERCRRSR